jgi:hypothetical protein
MRVTYIRSKDRVPPSTKLGGVKGQCSFSSTCGAVPRKKNRRIYRPLRSTEINSIRGSACVGPFGLDQSPAVTAWHEQTSTLTDNVNTANPTFSPSPISSKPTHPSTATSSMFDAVMATAMGACLADRNSSNTTGSAHVKGIRSVDFQGASGQVKFRRGSASQGTRDRSTIICSYLRI